MNLVEATVLLKKKYNARYVAEQKCFRIKMATKMFDVEIKFAASATGMNVWIDEVTLYERILPDDDLGKVKKVLLSQYGKISSSQAKEGLVKWINREMIRATLK